MRPLGSRWYPRQGVIKSKFTWLLRWSFEIWESLGKIFFLLITEARGEIMYSDVGITRGKRVWWANTQRVVNISPCSTWVYCTGCTMMVDRTWLFLVIPKSCSRTDASLLPTVLCGRELQSPSSTLQGAILTYTQKPTFQKTHPVKSESLVGTLRKGQRGWNLRTFTESLGP